MKQIDRIRSMNAEELADFIDELTNSGEYTCGYCSHCDDEEGYCRNCESKRHNEGLERAKEIVIELPVIEQKHGHWIIEQENIVTPMHIFTCSVCGEMFCDEDEYIVTSMHYCMNCGAKMDEVTE